MRVAVDLTKTDFKNPVGVDRYALEMTKALTEGFPEVNWLILVGGGFWESGGSGESRGSWGEAEILRVWPEVFSTQVGVALATWKDRKIDVLWSPVPTMPILRRPGLKTIVTIHDLEGSRLSTRWSLRLADAVVAVSEATGEAIRGRRDLRAIRDIRVIEEGVDTGKFCPKPLEEVTEVKKRLGVGGDYFLFVGTVGPRKNVENLIRGFAEFQKTKIENREQKGETKTEGGSEKSPFASQSSSPSSVLPPPTSELVVAGSVPDDYRQVYDLPKQLGISGHVKFLGRVDDADLPALYSGAIATCLVSFDEGFGLPVLESLACGRPVVVSNRGIMPELAGVCGVTVDPLSTTSISDGLCQVAQIDSSACRLQSQKYSWGEAAKKFYHCIIVPMEFSGIAKALTSHWYNGKLVQLLTVNILGVKVNLISFDETLRQISKFISEPRFHLVTTVNPEFILTAQKDPEFKEILNKADLSLPDGLGVVLAGKMLEKWGEKGMQRVAGADLVPALVKLAAEKGWSVGFLGGEDFKGQDVCKLVKQRFLSQYPSLNVAYCNREAAPEAFLTPIDILFVAFGAPKQEKFLAEFLGKLGKKGKWGEKGRVRVGIGVGGTFDFIVGKQKRAPLLCQKLGLEGLWRLVTEPKRWRRVFRAYVVFPVKFAKWEVRKRKSELEKGSEKRD